MIDATPWIDTHEHLVEEAHRLQPGGMTLVGPLGAETRIPPDWTALLVDYAVHDLVSAGMPAAATRAVFGEELGPAEKWGLVEPWFAAARTTGYLRAVDLTTQRLCGAVLSRETCDEVDGALRHLRGEGYYARVLREAAGVQRCQVHSLEADPFCETATPEVLDHDLSIVPLVFGTHPAAEAASGVAVAELDDYLDVLEWCFAEHGPRAVAVKCLWAYFRDLAVGPARTPPRAAFRRLRRGAASDAERRAVEDFLFRHCLVLAADAGLPVKVHLGTLAGNGHPRLGTVHRHVADITAVVQAHPRTTFVLMHMAWPHQEQLLALAKHEPNVVVDLCWSWILAPRSTAEFVARFLTTAPATKLLCFGGDVVVVENVVGHAEIARRGLQAALEALVADGWLDADGALALVPALMHGNAERVLPAPARRREAA